MKSQMASLLAIGTILYDNKGFSSAEIELPLLGDRFFRRTFFLGNPLFLHPALGGNFLLFDRNDQPNCRHFGSGGNAVFLERRHKDVITCMHLSQANVTIKIRFSNCRKADW